MSLFAESGQESNSLRSAIVNNGAGGHSATTNGASGNGASGNGASGNGASGNGASGSRMSGAYGVRNGNGAGATRTFGDVTPTMYAEYAGAVQRTLNRMPWNHVHAVVEAIVQTWEQGGQLFLMGNGGSASTATHLACDLGKNTAQPGLPRMRAQALNDNMALMTAYANDVGYDAVFSEQLRAQARPGDLVLAITTSGNSPNVLKAVEVAGSMGLRTIALCGYTGGTIRSMVDIAVVAPNHCVEQIEDIHMVLAHIVTVGVRGAMLAALQRGASFEDGVLVSEVAVHMPMMADEDELLTRTGAAAAHSNGGYATGYIPPATGDGNWGGHAATPNGHD